MPEFTDEDVARLRAAGISPEAAESQVSRLRRGVKPPRLLRPCTLGDGIDRLSEDLSGMEEEFLRASAEGRVVHFIPASGAASRMAETLEEARSHAPHNRVLAALLEGEGELARLSKALSPFHSYGDRVVTPLEEHIREAASLSGARGGARLHFTVSPEQETQFQRRLKEILGRLGTEGIRAEVSYSLQAPKTQTLALDEEGRPFRSTSGALVLRPGGHGSLLPNLERLGAEFAWIHNVDNIAVESRRAPGRSIRRALAGKLIRLARDRNRTDRPLRVCGMVPNTGESGGGPFWVQSPSEGEAIRIVEAAEIDSADPGQMEIFRAATHFNPVEMVCTLRDPMGNPYRLADFSDPEACFVANKIYEGRKLRALEWPGLWNGGMARWDTACVEIPLSLFTPVKTVMDLLRPEHQGE